MKARTPATVRTVDDLKKALQPLRLISVLPASRLGTYGRVQEASPSREPDAYVSRDEEAPLQTKKTANEPVRRRRERRKSSQVTLISFLICVLLPSLVAAGYYIFMASPQYMVESQFAVRGSDTSPFGMLGLSALPGANAQSADSYVVQNYIRSQQLAKDILRDQDYDVRTAYSREFIDMLYRISAELPFTDFEKYWQSVSQVEYNSISGNMTLRIFAFSPEDAKVIAEAVIKQSEQIVNELSAESRRQLIGTAQQEVARTEERLRNARIALQRFQNQSQTIDPAAQAQLEVGIVGKLEGQLADVITRLNALDPGLTSNSPAKRVIDRQISAIRAQIEAQRQRIGSGVDDTAKGNLADVATEFVQLSSAQEFAKEAYTAALAALETAKTDARKRDRYLATYIPPELPDASRYPKPIENSLLVFAWSFFGWLVLTFLIRTLRDHVS